MIATDLDGTLIGSANEFPLYTDFRNTISELRHDQGTIWVACTGRTLSSFKQFFAPMRMMGVMPDFVIIRHAYIFGIGRYGYRPYFLWNLRIRYMLWTSRLYMQQAIDEWHEMITGVCLGVSTVHCKSDRLCLRFDSEESADVAADLLKEKVLPFKQLRVFRYYREVDVRSVPFTKGLAVSELAKNLGIDAPTVLAIGNGHNDISMMNDHVAGMVGCPVNSEPEVMEVVHGVGGHVAARRSLGGVLDIIDAYRTGRVCSDLPEGWASPEEGRNPSFRRSSRSKRNLPSTLRVWLLLLTVYVVIVVFASFNLVPHISGAIMQPFRWLLSLVVRAMTLFWS